MWNFQSTLSLPWHMHWTSYTKTFAAVYRTMTVPKWIQHQSVPVCWNTFWRCHSLVGKDHWWEYYCFYHDPGMMMALNWLWLLSHTGDTWFLRLQIHFNKDGDAYGSYNIYQYQQKDNKYDYVPIGTWKEGWVKTGKWFWW